MSSRRGGVALLVASALTGVVAAAFIPRPPWGILAAIALAAATAGVAAGLMLLRRSDARPDGPTQRGTGWSAKRLRRAALIFGAVLMTFAVAAAAALVLPGTAPIGEPILAWSVVVVYGACGAALLAAGLTRVPSAVESSDRPADDPVDDAEWVRLGADGSGVDLRRVTAWTFQYQLIQVPLLLVVWLPLLAKLGPWAPALAIVATVIALAMAAVVIRRRRGPAWIARDGSALRHGSRAVPAAEINSAILSFTPFVPDATERDLVLTLGAPGRFRAAVHLRRRGRLVLTEAQTAMLSELVACSSIQLPRDEHDPTGRFSKSLYPNHLTKAESETVAAHPPGDGEPLPIGSW